MAEKQNPRKEIKEAKPSVKGFYSFIKEAWKNQSEEKKVEIRNKMIEWRAQPRVNKIEKPSRLDRARNLGYKAKKGFVVFRVTLERGGRARARPVSHRRTKRMGVKKILKMNYQWVAEQRVQNKYPNLEILNSYKLAKDGRFYFFEVIAVDPNMPEIKNDPTIAWITSPKNRNRAIRGLTSAAKKARGLRNRNNHKARPSSRANDRRGR
ncbi:50S ribosomal protein L15e [Candidatus Pacearchaeota archaeon]|nr:50S ribosomal protein L15e [Candidatus Pacearchaeota archaeon]